MSEGIESNSSNSTGKAVTYGGGTGVGAILLQLIEMVPHDKTKAILAVCVPPVSIGIAEFGKIIWDARKITSEEMRSRREHKSRTQKLEKRIKKIKKLLKGKQLSQDRRSELEAMIIEAENELLIQ